MIAIVTKVTNYKYWTPFAPCQLYHVAVEAVSMTGIATSTSLNVTNPEGDGERHLHDVLKPQTFKHLYITESSKSLHSISIVT